MKKVKEVAASKRIAASRRGHSEIGDQDIAKGSKKEPVKKRRAIQWKERFIDIHGNVTLEREGHYIPETIPEAVRKQSQEAGMLKEERGPAEAQSLGHAYNELINKGIPNGAPQYYKKNRPEAGPTNWLINKFMKYLMNKIMDTGGYHTPSEYVYPPVYYVVKPWSYATTEFVITMNFSSKDSFIEGLYKEKEKPEEPKRKIGRPRFARPGDYIPVSQKDMEKLKSGLYVLMEDGRVLLKKIPTKRKLVAPHNHQKHIDGLKEILQPKESSHVGKSTVSPVKKKSKVQKKAKLLTNNKR